MAMNAVPANMYASASLYVGDLARDVPEAELYEIFNGVGQVASIRICRDANTRTSLGYAYVNFHHVGDAERALDTMNYKLIHNRQCRIMWSRRDPALRKSGVGNIFVKNLHKDIDNQTLCDTFSKIGDILSCIVKTDSNGVSLGYGFVHFERQEHAQEAIAKINGKLIMDRKVYVAPFLPKAKRDSTNQFTNLYVKHIPTSYSEEDFAKLFSEHGIISSSVLRQNEKGNWGFVNFSSVEEAKAAVDNLHGFELEEGKAPLYVTRAQKRADRDKQLKKRYDQIKRERIKKYPGVNLYIKNLTDAIDDERLRTEFAGFGSISSAVVMRDKITNKSRNFGFVCFSSPEEAMKALNDMNGKMLDGKPLYVALAQTAEERKHSYAQRWATRSMGNGGVPVPMYPPMRTTGPMVFNPQMMHPGWGNQPQRMGNMRPVNYSLMPAAVNRNPPRRAGRGRGRGANLQNPPRQGQNFQYAESTHNPRNAAPQQAPGPVPQQQGSEEHDFVKEVAALPEGQRKNKIGTRLFPLVLESQPNKAPKITGMLLEMADSEIIELLGSPAALNVKIQEALEVLAKSEADEDA